MALALIHQLGLACPYNPYYPEQDSLRVKISQLIRLVMAPQAHSLVEFKCPPRSLGD